MPKLGRRSERQEFDFLLTNATSSRFAPFGTDNTPMLRSKIVGGRLVPVVERQVNPAHYGGVSSRYPRVETLHPITEKPNHLDPAMLRDFSKKLQGINQEFLNGHVATDYILGSTEGAQDRTYRAREKEFDPTFGQSTTYGRNRPDSKDVGRRYTNLPPIDSNKTKNLRSTVFEPEPWTQRYADKENYRSNPEPQAGYNNPGQTNGYVYENGYQGHQPNRYDTQPAYEYEDQVLYEPPPPAPRQEEPPRKTNSLSDRKYELLLMLPKKEFLPPYPLQLTVEQEAELLSMVAAELQGVDPSQLKAVYLDMSENYDRTLSGYSEYKVFFFCLTSAKVIMSSDLLRIVAAMFVSPSNPGEVNYEKMLSFLGTALKDTRTNGRAGRPVSPYYEHDRTKLLNMAEQQLHEDGIDFEGLQAKFQWADREQRETLSADQIKSIVFSKGVRLQESVVNKILESCEDPNRDGQYNWVKFMQFLEKVKPAHTGLPIPRSKKPLEYAKHVPSPVPNWPRAADSTLAPQVPNTVATPLWRKESYDSPRLDLHQMRDGRQSRLEDEEQQLQTNREQIEKIDKELKQLEVGYEQIKQKISSPREDSPWFKMFMEFANALYKLDVKSSGTLPAEEVMNRTREYNQVYNLEIPDYMITRCLADYSHLGRVNLHNYLTKLSCRDW